MQPFLPRRLRGRWWSLSHIYLLDVNVTGDTYSVKEDVDGVYGSFEESSFEGVEDPSFKLSRLSGASEAEFGSTGLLLG